MFPWVKLSLDNGDGDDDNDGLGFLGFSVQTFRIRKISHAIYLIALQTCILLLFNANLLGSVTETTRNFSSRSIDEKQTQIYVNMTTVRNPNGSSFIEEGVWSQFSPWVWTDTRGAINTDELVQRSVPRNTTIAMYGSSHLREIYFQMLHLEHGQSYNGKLSHEEYWIASGDPDGEGNRSICDPARTGYVDGLYGIDLVNCGRPTFRVVPEMGGNVVVSFKTFLHTPDADNLFKRRLEDAGLYCPDVLVVDIGIWGARGMRNKMGSSQTPLPTLTQTEELAYYIEWVQETFHQSIIAWVVGGSTFDDEIRSRLQGEIIFSKDRLLENHSARMPCVHGCGGPVTRVIALRLLDWIEQIRPDREGTTN